VSGPKNALAAWGASSYRPVELPSGMKALIKLPDINDMIRNQRLPQALRDLAMKYATEGINVAELRGEDYAQFILFSYELVGRGLKYIAPPDSEAWDAFLKKGGSPADEGWEPVTLTGAEIAEMDIDPADLEALGFIMGRQRTPNEVTASSRFDRGILTEEGRQAMLAADPGVRVGDYAGFRRQSGGADGRADGEDVREASERDHPDTGSGRRVRRGRSGGAPAPVRRSRRAGRED
jgi:hypothetical protein